MIASALRKAAVAAILIISGTVGPAFADDMSVCAKASSDDAIAACSRIIDTGGRDLSLAYYSRGLARYYRGDYDLVISDENEAIRRKPDYAFAYHTRALAYKAKKDLNAAIADFTQALKFNPTFVNSITSLGASYHEKMEYDRAIEEYNRALKIEPKSALASYSRGNAYHLKGDYDRAIADYNDAIKIKPDYVDALQSRGAAYESKADPDRAISDYSETIRLSPQNAKVYRNRGRLLADKNQLDRAIADYNESIRLDPTDAISYASRGVAYEKRGETALARQDFEKAVALPASNDPRANSGRQIAAGRLAALSPTTTTTVTATAPVTALATATPSASNDRRIALVIGNSAYRNAPVLPNPQRDAALVAKTLKTVGFSTVTLQTDLSKDALVNALRVFAEAAETADWAVVYYAGHGMEVGGVNYLLPVDARVAADRDIAFEAVPLGQVLNAAERAKKLRLVILDACRDNPFANQMKRTMTIASRSVTQGLAAVEPEAGTLVVYAAKDGETALDGDGSNSPFASAFVKNMQTPNLEVRRLFDFVRDDVMDVTKRKQKPFSYGSISGRQDFYFVAAK